MLKENTSLMEKSLLAICQQVSRSLVYKNVYARGITMFQFVERRNEMEIYQAEYCGESYKITYNPRRKTVEQILPKPVTDTLVNQFRKYKEE